MKSSQHTFLFVQRDILEFRPRECGASVLQPAGRGVGDHQQGRQHDHGGEGRSVGLAGLQQDAGGAVCSNGNL